MSISNRVVKTQAVRKALPLSFASWISKDETQESIRIIRTEFCNVFDGALVKTLDQGACWCKSPMRLAPILRSLIEGILLHKGDIWELILNDCTSISGPDSVDLSQGCDCTFDRALDFAVLRMGGRRSRKLMVVNLVGSVQILLELPSACLTIQLCDALKLATTLPGNGLPCDNFRGTRLTIPIALNLPPRGPPILVVASSTTIDCVSVDLAECGLDRIVCVCVCVYLTPG
jgi:hypothetical protein